MQNHPRSSPLCICGEFLWTSKLSLQVLAAVTVAVPTSTRARVLEGLGDLGTCTTYALCFRVDIANGVAPGRMAAGSGSCLAGLAREQMAPSGASAVFLAACDSLKTCLTVTA